MEKMNDWEYGIHPAKRESAIRRVFEAFMDFYGLAGKMMYFLMPFYAKAELPEDIAKAINFTAYSDRGKKSRSREVSGGAVHAIAKRRLLDAVEYEYPNLDAEAFADFMRLAAADIQSEELDKMRELIDDRLETISDEEYFDAAANLDLSLLFIKEELFEMVAKHTNRPGPAFRYASCFYGNISEL